MQEKEYLLNLLDDDADLKIFDEESGSYIPKIRECIMKLIPVSFNVATKKIPSVIRSVLKLANKAAIKFPLKQTVVNIVYEKVGVGKKYIGVRLRQKKKPLSALS